MDQKRDMVVTTRIEEAKRDKRCLVLEIFL